MLFPEKSFHRFMKPPILPPTPAKAASSDLQSCSEPVSKLFNTYLFVKHTGLIHSDICC